MAVSHVNQMRGADNRDVKPEHGFTLYAVGISVWMTLVACGGTTYMLPLVPSTDEARVYVIVQQLAYVATFFVVAAIAWHKPMRRPHVIDVLATLAFAVTDTCLALVALGTKSIVLLVCLGIAMGTGTTLGYMRWIHIVSYHRDSEILVLLFMASLVSTVMSAVFYFVPLGARLLIYGAVLVPASLALMWLNTRDLTVTEPRGTVRSKTGKGGEVIRALFIPTVCASVLTLVAPLASTLLVDTRGHDLLRTMLAQTANLVGLLGLAIALLVTHRHVRMRDVYTALLPFLASAVLVASFLDPTQRWFVLFFGDVCFCVVSFLLLLTSCELSSRLDVSVMVVYGILGGFVYLARLPEALLVIDPHVAVSGFSSVITAVLLYLLTAPVFLLPPLAHRGVRGDDAATAGALKRMGRLHGNLEGAQALAATHELIAETCAQIAKEAGLTSRQADVMARIAQGDSAQRVADGLGLSQNTVKTYRKAIYAALDIHSRQELCDYVMARATHQDAMKS